MFLFMCYTTSKAKYFSTLLRVLHRCHLMTVNHLSSWVVLCSLYEGHSVKCLKCIICFWDRWIDPALPKDIGPREVSIAGQNLLNKILNLGCKYYRMLFFLWIIGAVRSKALSCLSDSCPTLSLCLDPLSKEAVTQTLMIGQIVNLICWPF